MGTASWLTKLRQQKAIAVIRTDDWHVGREMANAVAAGGMTLIEITWNSDRPAQLVELLRQTLPACQIGAGTLLEVSQVRDAIAAGAEFLFTPHGDRAIIQMAVNADVPIVPGALTPTEIVKAWQTGATAVKVFPIQAVGGASYIRSLREPLGDVPLIPTGGVTIENAADFLAAGAIAVGLSGQLFPKEAIGQQDWQKICDRATDLLQRLNTVSR